MVTAIHLLKEFAYTPPSPPSTFLNKVYGVQLLDIFISKANSQLLPILLRALLLSSPPDVPKYCFGQGNLFETNISWNVEPEGQLNCIASCSRGVVLAS